MPSGADLNQLLAAADQVGMTTAVWARAHGDRAAVYDPDGSAHSFAKINARANKIARLLRARGLEPGDALALVCPNRAEFVEVLAATLRSGIRLTPVNWHLTPGEVAYIIQDCEAKAVVGDARVRGLAEIAAMDRLIVKLAIGGGIDGFESYEEALARCDGSDIADPVLGNTMMYTSGTTGRPKGVHRAAPIVPPREVFATRRYDPETSVQLCAGPAYHAAPLAFDVRAAMGAGVPLVFLDRWDSEVVLKTISEKKVTHLHLVPIMFQRLLALPAEVRARYPVDQVKFVVHGAAPCPPDIKHEMIKWFGPVLTEYYAGSEGGAGFLIDSDEWLRKPGSVGKRPQLLRVRILDEAKNDLPNGRVGAIYMQLPPAAPFTYFKDAVKTEAGRVDDFYTIGDFGYFDDDDYLFLTGRSAETIISGGVNIYPQEIDNQLIKHEAVADSATIGVPDEEWGEQVRAVILLKSGYEASPALAQEILEFGRKSLPSFKVPRSLDFVGDLPRTEAGKIQRNKVRAPYWKDRARQI